MLCAVGYRDSIIHVGGATSEADYNNISLAVLASSAEERHCLANVVGQEEALYTHPHRDVAALDLCGIKGDKRKVNYKIGLKLLKGTLL